MRQVEGIGALSALTFVLTLEDPHRFEKSRSVGAYLGLVPASDRSGDSDPREKRISKEGEEMLRKLLLGSAHYILGPFGSDSDLRLRNRPLTWHRFVKVLRSGGPRPFREEEGERRACARRALRPYLATVGLGDLAGYG